MKCRIRGENFTLYQVQRSLSCRCMHNTLINIFSTNIAANKVISGRKIPKMIEMRDIYLNKE